MRRSWPEQEVPSASEVRFAVKQKQLLMAELAATSEPAPADKPKSGSAQPAQRPAQRNPEHIRQL